LNDIASRFFLEAFSLSEGAVFAELVLALFELFIDLERTSRFLRGSFSFWRIFHARGLSLDDAPESWLRLLTSRSEISLYRLMFVLETAYVVTARLILAKAVQDKDVGRQLLRDRLHEAVFAQLRARADPRTGRVPIAEYAPSISQLFKSYSRTLFSGIFSEDIFDWWSDLHLSESAVRDRFSRALAQLAFSVLRFDFSNLDSDFLGELYQQYFDPETRKDLGEFYTPPDLVDLILDCVGYHGTGRLLDPACGSGTFLIRALRRYLNANAGRPPEKVLAGITDEFQLIGFDINPFAVLMSEINVAALLVPLYAEAVTRDLRIVLRRLPIIQTDSLRREFREGEAMHAGIQLGMDFGAEEITVRIDLPVQAGAEPLQVQLTVPRLEAALSQGLVRNAREWLLVLQGMFAALAARRLEAPNNERDLNDYLSEALSTWFERPTPIVRNLRDHTERIWSLVTNLREQHGDGRFLKMLEDMVLGLFLKHDIQYDYVVGNPPYVRIQNLPERQRSYWQGRYRWANGNFDIYIPFLERPLATDQPWLEEGGRLGYVISNSFLTSEAASSVRRLFPTAAKIISVTDFKAARFEDGNLFSGAMTYTCVLTAERTPSTADDTFSVVRFYPRPVPAAKSAVITRIFTKHRELSAAPNRNLTGVVINGHTIADAFWETAASLQERGWYFMPPDERPLFESLDSIGDARDPELADVLGNPGHRRLINYTSTQSGGFAGVQTSLDDVMILRVVDSDGDLVSATPKGGGAAVWLECSAVRPFLFGENVWRWSIRDQEWVVLFPYFRHEERYLLVPSDDYWDFHRPGRGRVFAAWPEGAPRLESHFPHLNAYLHDNERALRERERQRFVVGRSDEWRWYDLAYPRSLVEANEPKLVVQLLARSRQVAADRAGRYLFQAGGKGGGVYGISPLRQNDLWYLLGLLNSEATDFYLRHITQFYNPSGSCSYADAYLKYIPVPMAEPETRAEIEASARYLAEMTERINCLEGQIGSFPSSVFDHFQRLGRPFQGEELERQAEVTNLSRQLRASACRESPLLDGRTQLQFGRGVIRVSSSLARIVREMLILRGTLDRSKLLRTFFPTRVRDHRVFIETLSSWQDEVSSLEKQIETAEARHNQSVSALYGIEAHQLTIVRRFLTNF
jgi:N-6 DNA Methylase